LLAALAHYRERLVGQDPTRIQAIWRQLHNKNAGRVEHTALSGVEQALWDVIGPKAGRADPRLFGGPLRDKLRLYANINRHLTDRSPEGVRPRGATGRGRGVQPPSNWRRSTSCARLNHRPHGPKPPGARAWSASMPCAPPSATRWNCWWIATSVWTRPRRC
jgi:L-alanine-DL-glutamate epimerase-like enolase superfamily enzyme